jgi:mRNA interferase RelE/StbE
MAYKITIKTVAQKELEKIQKSFRERIINAIGNLAENPRPAGCKKLVNFDSHYRIRVADYRVIYKISDNELLIEVVKVANRKDVYR